VSYTITIYCNDPSIETTTVKMLNYGTSTSISYGDKRLGDYKEYTISGINGPVRFFATPADGHSFSKWIYRIGTVDSPQKTDAGDEKDKSFYHSGDYHIFIRAVGKVNRVESPWHAWSSFNIGPVNNQPLFHDIFDFYTDEYGLGEYQVHSGPVTFARSGLAHFGTSSGIDTVGFLSDSPNWSADYSEPASILAQDDNSGNYGNFDIGYWVDADTEYYLFVRGATGTETGRVSVFVTEPWNLDSSSYGTLPGKKSEEVYVNAFTLYRRKVSFSKSGNVTISSTGSYDTEGWIGTSPDWDRGEPTSCDAYNDDSGSGSNFSMTVYVEAGQDYYIWMRKVFYDTGGYVTLNISEVEEVINPIKKWSWSASNGSATKDETVAAFNAVSGNGSTRDFSHDVWNDMVDKVKEILTRLGLPWNEYHDTYENTKMTSAPYELTAQRFNSLRYNIGSIYVNGSGIEEVDSGDTVYGWYFTTLASRMNDWIDTL
jgi:hypothetical protein